MCYLQCHHLLGLLPEQYNLLPTPNVQGLPLVHAYHRADGTLPFSENCPWDSFTKLQMKTRLWGKDKKVCSCSASNWTWHFITMRCIVSRTSVVVKWNDWHINILCTLQKNNWAKLQSVFSRGECKRMIMSSFHQMLCNQTLLCPLRLCCITFCSIKMNGGQLHENKLDLYFFYFFKHTIWLLALGLLVITLDRRHQ